MKQAVATFAAVVAFVLTVGSSADAAEIRTWKLQDPRIDLETAKLGVSAARRDGYPKIPRDALRVNVMLPDGYNSERHFPVLYLLHGGGWGYDFWTDPEGGDLLNTAGDLDAVVVMPEGGRGWYTDWWNEGTRTNPGWESFHLQAVRRLVHRRLEIRKGRRWHAVAGFSMGGLGAMHYAARRPGYFGSAASLSGILSIQRPESPTAFDGLSMAFSGAIDDPGAQPETHQDVFGDPAEQEFYWSGHNPVAEAQNLAHSRLFVTVGDNTPYSPADLESTSYGTPAAAFIEDTIRQYAGDFETAAIAAGVDELTVNRRAGLHTNFAARLGLREAIAWDLFERPPARPRRYDYATAAPTGQMWNLRFRFQEAPDDLITFERRGRRLNAEGTNPATTATLRLRRGRCAIRLETPFAIDLREACRGALLDRRARGLALRE